MTITVTLREATDAAEARRQAVAAAEAIGMDDEVRGRIAIAATEMATNVIRHGGGGEMVVAPCDARLDLVALDKGPGMANVAACRVDGYSTYGSSGEGLGAISRQADAMEIYTRAGQGAAVLARFGEPRAPTIAGLNIAYAGEAVSGDAWTWAQRPDSFDLVVADGLGHGLMAHAAAKAAMTAFAAQGHQSPAKYLEYAHGVLRPTRGAALAMARVSDGQVSFAGIGNIAASIVSGGVARKMISHNGTLGHIAKRFQAFDYPAQRSWLLIMHSDGLGSSWSLDRYPGLSAADPMLVAAVLYRDFSRGRDDVTVVVARDPTE